MNMASNPLDKTIVSELSAYLDGELSPADRQRVAEAIEGDSRLREVLRDLRRTRNLLQALPRESIPEDLAGLVKARMLSGAAVPGRPVWRRWWVGITASAACLAFVVAVGWHVLESADQTATIRVAQRADGERESGSAAKPPGQRKPRAEEKDVDEAVSALPPGAPSDVRVAERRAPLPGPKIDERRAIPNRAEGLFGARMPGPREDWRIEREPARARLLASDGLPASRPAGAKPLGPHLACIVIEAGEAGALVEVQLEVRGFPSIYAPPLPPGEVVGEQIVRAPNPDVLVRMLAAAGRNLPSGVEITVAPGHPLSLRLALALRGASAIADRTPLAARLPMNATPATDGPIPELGKLKLKLEGLGEARRPSSWPARRRSAGRPVRPQSAAMTRPAERPVDYFPFAVKLQYRLRGDAR